MFVGMGANSGGAYNLESSLRFRSSASAYLSRTPTTAGNLKTWTWSGWVKRGNLDTDYYTLFGAGTSLSNRLQVFFWGSPTLTDSITVYNNSGGTTRGSQTNAVFRDSSSWYHIVVSADTTDSTAENRIKIYINGVQQSTVPYSSGYILQNTDLNVNNIVPHAIGKLPNDLSNFFDGYLTEINHIDGQALTPSDFGEYDTTTGVWKPKEYTGTYGTNGFYLDMSTSSSTVLDQSSNSNDWTANNMNLTTSSATTYDIMNDVPTLTDEDTANFATLNPLGPSGLVTNRATVELLDGNLTNSDTANVGFFGLSYSTIQMNTGKFYFECISSWDASSAVLVGILGDEVIDHLGRAPATVAYVNDGTKMVNTTFSAYGSSFVANDVIGVAFDADAQTIEFYKNNVGQGSISVGNSSLGGYRFYVSVGWSSGSKPYNYVNFGQRPFAYTPPTGYKKLNTYNLPDSTIADGSQYMNTVLYTGNGGTNAITGVGFSPDFVWYKRRNLAADNNLFDTIRGATKWLSSNKTNAETTISDSLTSFDSDGFTLGADGGSNASGSTFVAWNWKASDSSPVSNTDGTITSTVSANTTSGFSVVTYTGNGTAGATVGHGLGVAPKVMIVKRRDTADNWAVYHSSIGNANGLFLDLTNASSARPYWNSTTPTSSVATFNNSTIVNTSGGTYVAYCFADVEGFSKFGSYTGNGSADGPFIYTGFRPAFVLIKRTDTSGYHWYLVDTKRDSYNVMGKWLYPSLNNAETADSPKVDSLSNGFKLRFTDGATNASGGTYVFMCFAETPFKQSLAR